MMANALEYFADIERYGGITEGGEELAMRIPVYGADAGMSFYAMYKTGQGCQYEYIMLSPPADEIRERCYQEMECIFEELPHGVQYKIIKQMESMELDVDVDERDRGYLSIMKYPLYSVRGGCGMEEGCCQTVSVEGSFKLPCCFGRKVGCSDTAQVKNPEFHEILTLLVCWLGLCPTLDAVYVLHDLLPGSQVEGLGYSLAFLAKDGRITYITDSREAERLYREYNEKYPCDTSGIEADIRERDGAPGDFHF